MSAKAATNTAKDLPFLTMGFSRLLCLLTTGEAGRSFAEPIAGAAIARREMRGATMRKLIAFDEDTFDKLKQLARDRMATLQELADEAFADLLKKHGIPIDLRDALRKSARQSKADTEKPKARRGRQP